MEIFRRLLYSIWILSFLNRKIAKRAPLRVALWTSQFIIIIVGIYNTVRHRFLQNRWSTQTPGYITFFFSFILFHTYGRSSTGVFARDFLIFIDVGSHKSDDVSCKLVSDRRRWIILRCFFRTAMYVIVTALDIHAIPAVVTADFFATKTHKPNVDPTQKSKLSHNNNNKSIIALEFSMALLIYILKRIPMTK